MRLSSRQLRERAHAKPRPVKPDVPYSETGKLGPDDMKKWKRPEPPIEIIG
jgi:hypothetical protein